MKKNYQMSYEEVLENLKCKTEGLSNEDVVTQRENYGSNILEESKSTSVIIIFLSQFKDFLVIILMVAAIISAIMGKVEMSSLGKVLRVASN